MGLLSRLKNKSASQTRFQLITDRGNGYYQWDGKIYQSDIVRSCIRPKVKAIGKLVAKHVRTSIGPDGQKKIEVNPEPYLRFLLEEPNPYMSGQKLQEKLATQLCLNNNAFALIIRDANGFATEIYPITALSVEAIYDNNATLYLKFVLQNGKSCIYPYADIIHLRNDYNDNDIFGSSMSQALKPLMDIISTTDQGIVKAIKNSGTVQWLLKLTRSVRPEDVADAAKQLTDLLPRIEQKVAKQDSFEAFISERSDD